MMVAALLFYIMACQELDSTKLIPGGWNICQFSEPTKWCGADGGVLTGFGCELSPDFIDIMVDPTEVCNNTNGPQAKPPHWPAGAFEMRSVFPMPHQPGQFYFDTRALTPGFHALCVRARSLTTPVIDQWVMTIYRSPDDSEMSLPPVQ